MADMKIYALEVGMIRTNCYLILNEESHEMIIVDPGDDADLICEKIRQLDGRPAAIFLTHGHYDHILGVNDLRAAYPEIEVFIGEKDAAMLKDDSLNCDCYGTRITVEPDRLVSEGTQIDLAGFHCTVLHTPGHTAGSVCYYYEEQGVLFAGDTLFFRSYGRTDLPTGNSRDMVMSLTRLLTELPDDVTVLCGHDRSTTIGYEKRVKGFQ